MIVTRKKAFVNKAVLQGKKMTNVPALYELGLLLLVWCVCTLFLWLVLVHWN